MDQSIYDTGAIRLIGIGATQVGSSVPDPSGGFVSSGLTRHRRCSSGWPPVHDRGAILFGVTTRSRDAASRRGSGCGSEMPRQVRACRGKRLGPPFDLDGKKGERRVETTNPSDGGTFRPLPRL